MSNPMGLYESTAPRLAPQVRAMLEHEMQSFRERLPDLPPSLVQDLVYMAATEWEQNTGLKLEILAQNQSPLFQLVHLKLIFQLFAGRVQGYLKKRSQRKALEQVRETYYKQFQQMCASMR